MKILVTGGVGFIGTNLVAHLVDRPGSRLRVLDRAPARSDRAPLADDRVEVCRGDILDEGAVADAVAGVDAIVHLAAATGVVDSIAAPRPSLAVNVEGTLNLLEAARAARVRKFVFASSNAAIGAQPPPLDETRPAAPVSPYGAGKLAGEALCSAWAHAYGLETVALRFSNVYGPYSDEKGSAVATFFRAARTGGPVVIHGDGSQTRDFLFVGDLSEAIRLAIERGRGGALFHIASGVETPVTTLARKICRLVGAELGVEVPLEFAPARAGDVPRNYSSVAHARESLGWVPGVGLDEGLAHTWRWFKAQDAAAVGVGDRSHGAE